VAYTTWRGGVGAIIILPIVLCRPGAIYLRANMIPISWQAGGAHSMRAKEAPLLHLLSPALPQALTEGE